MPDVLLIEESSGTRILGRREYTSILGVHSYMRIFASSRLPNRLTWNAIRRRPQLQTVVIFSDDAGKASVFITLGDCVHSPQRIRNGAGGEVRRSSSTSRIL